MKKMEIEKMECIVGGNRKLAFDLMDLGCVGVGIFVGIAIPVMGFAMGLACGAAVEYGRTH
ncbi:hypothetical protein [Draconibacterium halophilum]|uniref:Uncharacterized protein n=1 Tax=Draconibacterium halophilum TaxID=2706887 RepID=A0A6C0RIC4_9BACT|nr:hypothetical protein [Draconibacterium halophilum]QIA09592.1 hypothetical protein G0Q07_18585 [Draconibacterium halophilum]